jgi:sugar phosphate isomerase/epimerase
VVGPDALGFCAATAFRAPVLERLEAARTHGFRWISLLGSDVASDGRAGLGARELGRRVVDAGMAVSDFEAVSTWLPHHRRPEPADGRRRPRDAEGVCPLAAAAGARSVSVVDTTDQAVSLDAAAEAFAHVCDVAADHGLDAALEFLPWTGIPSLSSALGIVAAAGRTNGTVLVDTWHLFRSGSTLEQLVAAPASAIGSVQVNDAPASAEPDLLDETMHRRLVPGAGAFDLVGFVRSLDAIGYEGPVGVEVISDELSALPVDVIARRCADGIRSVLAAAGEAGQ